LKAVEFCKEDNQMNASKGYYSRIYTMQRHFREVAICNEMSLVSTVMLDSKYKMDAYLLVAFEGSLDVAMSLIVECIIFMKLVHLYLDSILLFIVTILLVESNCM
jgi:hypothetical protein